MASLARKSRRAKRREKRNAARNGTGDDAASIASTTASDSTVASVRADVEDVHGATPECQAIYKILTGAGTDPEKLPEEILNYVSSAASDKLTTPEDLAGILSSMEIVATDGDDESIATKTAQSIMDAVRPKKEDASKADDHKKQQYKNLVRNKESEAIAMSALWGMKKQNVNEGMNGWVQNGGATIVDWLAKNSKSGRRRIRLAAKEEEKRKKLLDEHIAYIKMLRRAEAEAYKSLPSKLLPSSSAKRDLLIDDCSFSAPDGKVLCDNGQIHLVYGRKYGLIGKNGAGKTTLLRAMAKREIDGVPDDLRMVHVSQEIDGTDTSALLSVMSCDYELIEAKKEEQRLLADPDADPEALQQCMETLELLEASTAESRAVRILAGLNFTKEMLHVPTKRLSGGWRQRVALAKGLYLEPQLLLLDEPTNHLDLESVLWLENFLCEYSSTLVIVSHDRNFLNNVCTDIMHLNRQKLSYYRGDYENFVQVVAEQEKQQAKKYEAQQKKRAHMQEFIDKNRYNAKKASMAQSRIKAMERMELVENVQLESGLRFDFPDPGPLDGRFVTLTDVNFRYSDKTPMLFQDVDFHLTTDSRIGLVGPNGVGKSTLLNVIYGYSKPTRGIVTQNPRLRIGVFSQHHTESLDLRLTPLEQMRAAYDGFAGVKGEEKARAQLGRFGVTARMANRPIVTLSGGQKSRLVLAMVLWKKPHLLILDEPTNHLDMETIYALAEAVNSYRGGVIVVSHDQHFMNMCLKETYEIRNKALVKLPGGLEDYKKKVMKEMNGGKR